MARDVQSDWKMKVQLVLTKFAREKKQNFELHQKQIEFWNVAIQNLSRADSSVIHPQLSPSYQIIGQVQDNLNEHTVNNQDMTLVTENCLPINEY